MQRPSMTRSEVARFYGCSLFKVRLLEWQGFLHPRLVMVTKGRAGVRLFSPDEVERVAQLLPGLVFRGKGRPPKGSDAFVELERWRAKAL